MPRTTIDARDLVFDKVFLPTVVLAVALLSGLAWLGFGGGDPNSKKPKTFTHIHCPACREEVIFSPKLVGKRCMSCSANAALVPTIGTLEDLDKDSGNGGKIVFFLLAAFLIVPGVIYVAIIRLAALRQKLVEYINRTLIARCPFCQRKVAYPATKARTWSTCYQCKTAFELPSDDLIAG